ncbi:hypothetical protein K438DRAFT_1749323 [Mycena galopus ATCC 62051]|nr:hypothetical protein K438DRAFT_1749323 [Mycena galopus ATCC 62051]
MANSLLRASTDNSADALSRRIELLETANSLLQTRANKLTPWRVTNTAVLLGLGVYKAAGTYLGQTTGPNTADWIVGVLWALIVYWVEPMVPFYEEHRAEDDSESEEFSLHWFFTQEVSSAVLVTPFFVFFSTLFFAAVLIKLGVFVFLVLYQLRKSLGKHHLLRFFRRLLSDWSLSGPIDVGGLLLVFLYMIVDTAVIHFLSLHEIEPFSPLRCKQDGIMSKLRVLVIKIQNAEIPISYQRGHQ